VSRAAARPKKPLSSVKQITMIAQMIRMVIETRAQNPRS